MEAGFAVFPGVFTAAEMFALGVTLDALPLDRSRAGARHLLKFPRIAEFAADPRLLSIARAWLGAGAVPFRATLFDKSAESNWLIAWHQDTALPVDRRVDAPGWWAWSEKLGVLHAHAPSDVLATVVALRIHLDDSNDDNGPLRVIPGSHAMGVLDDPAVHAVATRSAPVTCRVPRGGVLAMRPLIIHASSKVHADSPRRVLHVEYAMSRDIRGGLRLAIA